MSFQPAESGACQVPPVPILYSPDCEYGCQIVDGRLCVMWFDGNQVQLENLKEIRHDDDSDDELDDEEENDDVIPSDFEI